MPRCAEQGLLQSVAYPVQCRKFCALLGYLSGLVLTQSLLMSRPNPSVEGTDADVNALSPQVHHLTERVRVRGESV